MKASLPDKERFSVNVARIKKGGKEYEIVIDADKAIEYRHTKQGDVADVVVNKDIFYDAKKGLRASENEMKEIFGTSDVLEVAKIILMEGEIQLTAAYRNKLQEDRRKKIVSLIARNAVDPKTHFPHPPARIEAAMAEAKARIDEHRSAEEQVQSIVKQLAIVLPIKFEIHEIEVIIPANYAAKSFSVLKGYGTLLKDEWQNDGSLYAVIEIPAGLREEFYDKINAVTHGDILTKLLKTR